MPRMVNEQTPPDIKPWLDIILESLDGQIDESRYSSSIFEQVIDAVKRDNISPDEFRILKDEESWEDTLIEEREIGREEDTKEDLQKDIKEDSQKDTKEDSQKGSDR